MCMQWTTIKGFVMKFNQSFWVLNRYTLFAGDIILLYFYQSILWWFYLLTRNLHFMLSLLATRPVIPVKLLLLLVNWTLNFGGACLVSSVQSIPIWFGPDVISIFGSWCFWLQVLPKNFTSLISILQTPFFGKWV